MNKFDKAHFSGLSIKINRLESQLESRAAIIAELQRENAEKKLFVDNLSAELGRLKRKMNRKTV